MIRGIGGGVGEDAGRNGEVEYAIGWTRTFYGMHHRIERFEVAWTCVLPLHHHLHFSCSGSGVPYRFIEAPFQEMVHLFFAVLSRNGKANGRWHKSEKCDVPSVDPTCQCLDDGIPKRRIGHLTPCEAEDLEVLEKQSDGSHVTHLVMRYLLVLTSGSIPW